MTLGRPVAARWSRCLLSITSARDPAARGDRVHARVVSGLRTALTRAALGVLARSSPAAHRDAATALAAALEAGDHAAARSIKWTGLRSPDLRTTKVVSRRHRFLWIGVPKAASQSLAKALSMADPTADVIDGRTLEQVFAARPEVRDYHRFAFIRHPLHRAFSFWAWMHVETGRCSEEVLRFIEPFHGLREGMTFAELCRWLSTPYGSDAFADRHWLSQHRQIRLPDGRLPDFIGRYERLDTDWGTVTARLGLPFRPLPKVNGRPESMVAEEHLEGDTVALLRRRYADDFALGGYEVPSAGPNVVTHDAGHLAPPAKGSRASPPRRA